MFYGSKEQDLKFCEKKNLRYLPQRLIFFPVRTVKMKNILTVLILYGMCFSTGISRLHFASYLPDQKMKSLVNVSMEECDRECQRRKACWSINYNRKLRLCELNTNKTGVFVELMSAPGLVFKSKTDLLLFDTGYCKSLRCQVDQVCRQTTEGPQCLHEECQERILVPNAEVTGNMNNIGDRVKVRCNAGFGSVGKKSVVCEDTGRWSNVGQELCEPLCSAPCIPDNVMFNGAVVLSETDTIKLARNEEEQLQGHQIMSGSRVMLLCKAPLVTNGQEVVSCEKGNWTEFPTCIGIGCSSEFACAINMVCVSQSCACLEGTSYSYSLRACVDRCSGDYASTFTKVPNKGHWGPANLKVFSSISESECKQKCLQETTFTCRSFDYHFGIKTCYLQNEVHADYPHDLNDWQNGAYYQRDCW